MHGLVTLFLEVITLAIILLVVGLVVPCVLFVATTMIMASIISIMNKNSSRLDGCLTLLEEGNHSERVGRYHLVQVGKLVLVRLSLREEDLFTLLLHHPYVHCLTEVVTLEVAEKLHLMPHELVHLLCHTKPANQLVANVRELVVGLKVVSDALVKVCLCMICIIRASFCNDAGPFSQTYILKALTH